MITLTHHRNSGRVFASHEQRPNALYDVSRMYIAGKKPAQFPLPALIVSFDYWGPEDTDNGKPLIYMMEHHRPGRWRQVAKFGEGENYLDAG